MCFGKACLAKIGKQYSSYAPLVLRLAVGTVFAAHGYLKLTAGGPAISGFLASVGLPEFMAWPLILIELLGGLLLILGLFTRLAALLIAAIMVVAIVTVKLNVGLIAPPGAGMPGMELDLALLAGAVSIFLLGPGKPSADLNMMKKEL